MTKFIVIFVISVLIFSCNTSLDNNEMSIDKINVPTLTDSIKLFYVGDSALTLSFREEENVSLEEYENAKTINGEKITTKAIGDTIQINLYKDLGGVYYKGACQINGDSVVLNYWPITETEVSAALFYKFIYKIKDLDYKYIISRRRTNPYLYRENTTDNPN